MKNNNDLKIKRELDTVYIDSSGTKHLNHMKALCAEAQIQMGRDRKLQKKQRIMEIVELMMRVLKSENWGVYYKNKPIQSFNTQDGNSLYEVNQVDDEEIEKVITEALTWAKTDQTSSQSENSKTG